MPSRKFNDNFTVLQILMNFFTMLLLFRICTKNCKNGTHCDNMYQKLIKWYMCVLKMGLKIK